MKSNDLVKYLTIQLVERMDQPKTDKKRSKEKKTGSLSFRWFGLIPLSLKVMTKKRFRKNS